MANKWNEFVTSVKLNTTEAEDKLKSLRKTTDDLIKKRDKLINGGGSKSDVNALQKQIDKNEKSMRQLEKQATNVIDVINNMDSSSLEQLLQAQRLLNKELQKTPQNTEYFKELSSRLQAVKTSIAGIREATKQNFNETQNLKEEAENLNQVLRHLDSSSLKDLGRAANEAKRQMQEAAPNSTEYNQAAAALKTIEGRIKEVNLAQQQVNTAIDKYNDEIARTAKDAQKVQQETKLIDQTLSNLSTAKIREMEYTVQVLNERLRETKRGTDEYKQLVNQLKKVKAELQSVNREQEVSTSNWTKFNNFLNKNWGAITQWLASLSGITFTVRKCVSNFAKMDEALTSVMKYTGQTKEEVEAMNEDFKKMDTRTPREQLNELAGAAGRLGITSKSSIEEFVDAADKINVALGDDLGEGAVDQIGKLAMAFGEDDKMGLRGAMLATGSALNELAQNSSANAGYLVDFTSRVAGVGKQLGLTQAQIMGFGAVMDENMQRDEMASTAFSQLLTKMATDTVKFAKMAGKSVGEFSKMMKEDVNGAVIALFENLRKSGGFSNLAKIFNDMNLDGTRCVQVLSTMADKIDDIKTRQNIATQAYASGTSVLNEFNTANTNAQAELDKAKKNFSEITIELGEKLMPIARYGITTTSLAVRGLSTLVDIISKYKGTLARLAATIIIINTLMNLSTIKFRVQYYWVVLCDKAHKAYTVTTGVMRAALVALHAVLALLKGGVQSYIAVLQKAKIASMTNPWTALATVILSVGVAVYELVSRFKDEEEEAEKAALATDKFYQINKMNKELTEEANKSVAEEVTKLKSLQKTLEDSNAKYEDRQKALYQIKQMVPSYHGALTKEGTLINNNVQVLVDYCNNLVKAARAQAAFNKMVSIQEQSLNHESLKKGRLSNQTFYRQKMMKEFNYDPRKDRIMYLAGEGTYILDAHGNKKSNALSGAQMTTLNTYQQMYDWNQKRIDQENKILEVNKAQTDELQKQVQAAGTITNDNGKNNEGKIATSDSGYSPSGSTSTKKVDTEEKIRKKQEAERKKRMKEEIQAEKDKMAQEQADNTFAYATQGKLYKDYLDDKHDIAERGYEAIKKIYQKYGEDTGEIDEKISDEEKKRMEDRTKSSIKEIEKKQAAEKAKANEDYYNPSSDIYLKESALQERLFQIDMEAQQEKIDALQAGTEEWLEARDEMEQMQQEHSVELQQQYADRLARYREQWGRADIETQKEIELNGLDDLLEKKLIKEQEYQEMKKQIELQYDLQLSEQEKNNSHNEVTARNAHTAFQTASNIAEADEGEKKPTLATYLLGDITRYKDTFANLKEMYEDDKITFEEYQQAKAEAFGVLMSGLTSKAQAAFDSISQIMDGMSSYYDAQSQYEQNVVTKKYEKQINAAGNNSAKKKKLEEKEQKEIAKIKTKYNKKAMKIELAKATAQMILGVMSAYTSAFEGAPYPANLVLAPIAAGIAMAAGMLNIATIKKQHAAEEAGYYTGGFTGGTNYRRTAGVVHEGEFVANHQALANPNVMPVLQLIDEAQRTNTIGSLTANDVTRQLGQGGTVVSAPTVNVQTDNSELEVTLNQARDTIEKLGSLLDGGIVANVSMEDFKKQEKHWNKIQSNK